MPELPEVETVRLSLMPHIIGKKIIRVDIRHKKTVSKTSDFSNKLAGLTFKDIDRIGKLLIFSFEETDLCLCGHLKMTGQFMWQSETAKAGGGHSLTKRDFYLPHKHTRVIFRLSDGSALYFNDLRLFGYLDLVKPDDLAKIKSGYGIEPGQPNFRLETFKNLFIKRKTNLKALLLNQNLIAGLGNIYCDEVCFASGISPRRQTDKITAKEQKKLFESCKKIIKKAIKYGGTTFRDYNDANGNKGNFIDHLRVYGRGGKPCLKCGAAIKKIRWAGRGTHFCPKCQR